MYLWYFGTKVLTKYKLSGGDESRSACVYINSAHTCLPKKHARKVKCVKSIYYTAKLHMCMCVSGTVQPSAFLLSSSPIFPRGNEREGNGGL